MAIANAVRAGRAFVELFADDSKMQATLKRAQQRLSAFGASVRQMGTASMAIGSAIMAPMIASAKLFADAGDEVHKMALRTGMSTETLSRLGFAAEQSGASLKDIDTGFRGLARFMLQVERGGSAAADTLDALGLKADQLRRMTPEEQFKTIADSIARIEDPTKRAGLAMQVFGRSGQQLVPLLSEGRKGIEALEREADRLGLTINQETADAAAALTDALNRMQRTAKAASFTLGGALAPQLTELTNQAAAWLITAGDWIRANQAVATSLFNLAAAAIVGGAGLIVFGTGATLAGRALGVLAKLLPLLIANARRFGAALALLSIAAIARKVYHATDAMREFNDQLERANGLTLKLTQAERKRQAAILAKARSIEDPEERKKYLQEQLAQYSKNAAGLAAQEHKLRREFADKYSLIKIGTRAVIPWNIFGNKTREMDEREIAEVSRRRKAARAFADLLEIELSGQTPPATDEPTDPPPGDDADKSDGLTDEVRDAIEAAFGPLRDLLGAEDGQALDEAIRDFQKSLADTNAPSFGRSLFDAAQGPKALQKLGEFELGNAASEDLIASALGGERRSELMDRRKELESLAAIEQNTGESLAVHRQTKRRLDRLPELEIA